VQSPQREGNELKTRSTQILYRLFFAFFARD